MRDGDGWKRRVGGWEKEIGLETMEACERDYETAGQKDNWLCFSQKLKKTEVTEVGREWKRESNHWQKDFHSGV